VVSKGHLQFFGGDGWKKINLTLPHIKGRTKGGPNRERTPNEGKKTTGDVAGEREEKPSNNAVSHATGKGFVTHLATAK